MCRQAQEKTFRSEKRFPVNPCALALVTWRRVIIDESQLVRSMSTKKAKMAAWLRAERRWCVSGTPMEVLDDLQGSLCFLGHEPMADARAWRRARQGRDALVRACFEGGLMWRNSKSSVRNELALPVVVVRDEFLTLGPIEELAYADVAETAARLPDVQRQLQRLREAAIHMSVGVHGMTRQRESHAQKDAMPVQTLGDVLTQLIANARNALERALRELLSHLAASAALHLACQRRERALAAYRRALDLIRQADASQRTPVEFGVDTLQRVHVLCHLAGLLEGDERQALEAELGRAEKDFALGCRARVLSAVAALDELLGACDAGAARAAQVVSALGRAEPSRRQRDEANACGVCREMQSGPACENCRLFSDVIAPLEAEAQLLAAAMKRVASERDLELKELDYLDQCKIRLEVASREGAVATWRVREDEVPARLAEAECGVGVGLAEVDKAKAKLGMLAKEWNAGKPECPVCFEVADKKGFVFPCNHILCEDCFKGWKQASRVLSCTLCRTRALTTTSASPAPPPPPPRPALNSLGVKIEAVVQLLTRRLSRDKVVVFSSFDRALDLVRQGLSRQGAHCVYFEAKKDVVRLLPTFESSPDVNVCLIPYRYGGQGLNLVCATHVVLIEPLLNRSLEQQAVARVHRIGQTAAQVNVWRFFVRGTVEERILVLANERGSALEMLEDDDGLSGRKDTVDDDVVRARLLV